ncbi:hypothetical protein IAE22_27880, partial [Bacillus sp. S34]|nr:hypothetical protein [Bacillus sp. S34]
MSVAAYQRDARAEIDAIHGRGGVALVSPTEWLLATQLQAPSKLVPIDAAFAVLAVVVLLGIRLLSPAVGTAGLPNVVQDFLTLAISVVVES